MRAVATPPRVRTGRGAQHPQGTVYIVKLERPLGNLSNRRATASWYCGWTDRDPEERLAEHRAGRGSAMLRAAAERGIPFTIVFTMPGTRADERAVKRYKCVRRWLERARQLRLPL